MALQNTCLRAAPGRQPAARPGDHRLQRARRGRARVPRAAATCCRAQARAWRARQSGPGAGQDEQDRKALLPALLWPVREGARRRDGHRRDQALAAAPVKCRGFCAAPSWRASRWRHARCSEGRSGVPGAKPLRRVASERVARGGVPHPHALRGAREGRPSKRVVMRARTRTHETARQGGSFSGVAIGREAGDGVWPQGDGSGEPPTS